MVAPPKPARSSRAASQRPGADLETLAQLGLGNAPREPGPRAPRRPPNHPGHADALRAALTGEGYTIVGIDELAVKAVAALDGPLVERIVLWIQHRPGADPPPGT